MRLFRATLVVVMLHACLFGCATKSSPASVPPGWTGWQGRRVAVIATLPPSGDPGRTEPGDAQIVEVEVGDAIGASGAIVVARGADLERALQDGSVGRPLAETNAAEYGRMFNADLVVWSVITSAANKRFPEVEYWKFSISTRVVDVASGAQLWARNGENREGSQVGGTSGRVKELRMATKNSIPPW